MSLPSPLALSLRLGDRTLSVGPEGELRLLSAEGLGGFSVAIASEAQSLTDGSAVIGHRVLPRRILLEVEVPSREDSDRCRALLLSFFQPGITGTLTVSRGAVSRVIDFLPEELTLIQPTCFDFLRARVTLFCADPYFRLPDDIRVSDADAVPFLAFPFTSLVGVGVTAGLSFASHRFYTDNVGDVSVGFTATLRADGAAVNPTLSCGSLSLCIRDTLAAGDTYIISTCPGDKKLLKNGVPVFCFTLSSVFFTLPRGKSTVTLTSDSGEENLTGALVYCPRYLGV